MQITNLEHISIHVSHHFLITVDELRIHPFYLQAKQLGK